MRSAAPPQGSAPQGPGRGNAQIADLAPATLPDRSWVDLSTHCFAKELMMRPGGLSPKYGAVDRDYFGAEYDGFQDIFTSALYTNLEWGRFDVARAFLDDYFTRYVEPNGMINMRGPEIGQSGSRYRCSPATIATRATPR